MSASARLALVVVLACSTMLACTGLQGGDEHDGPEPADGAAATGVADGPAGFCDAMAHLIVLLEPGGPSSPQETKNTFQEAAKWFEQARASAPEPIAADVAIYADAYKTYTEFLDESGYRLDIVFSTTEGHDLAIETSHTLTPAIADHVIGECGLSFEGGG